MISLKTYRESSVGGQRPWKGEIEWRMQTPYECGTCGALWHRVLSRKELAKKFEGYKEPAGG